MTVMIIIILFLMILIGLVLYVRRDRAVIYDDFNDEETVTTTTVTTTTTTEDQTQPQPQSGNLIATVGIIYAYQKEGNTQWYVVDPVDKEETAVNANDDYYRDAGGKVWDLQ